MAAAGALVAETIAPRRRAARARASRRASSTGSPRSSSARAAASRPPRATAAIPPAICISPNDVVVHGIPGAYVVAEGDLVTIDVGVTLDGYIADSAYTFGVGEIDPRRSGCSTSRARRARAGIEQARPSGNRVGDISHAVQRVVEGAGFSVVRSLVGHGVGRSIPRGPADPELRPARPRPAPRPRG